MVIASARGPGPAGVDLIGEFSEVVPPQQRAVTRQNAGQFVPKSYQFASKSC